MNAKVLTESLPPRIVSFGKNAFEMLKETAQRWWNDNPFEMGAALAYYTAFSLAPILVIAIAMAGFVFGSDVARQHMLDAIDQAAGPSIADAAKTLLASAQNPGSGIVATVISLIALFFGATGVFAQLQQSLNTIWGVKPDPKAGWFAAIKDRFLSFGVVCAIGFLLLVSLVVSTVLQTLSHFLTPASPPGGVFLWQLINGLVSFVLITLMFAVIYKLLPDVKITWSEVWVGAAVTALLFALGKYLIGLYLAQSGVMSAYGAAGSLAVILLWVFYSSQIFLVGAEFTRVYAEHSGNPLRPAANAVPLSARTT